MNLLHLQYFYVVAKEGGFLKASEALRIQQPAISRMVKQLEESMGFRLFERVGRNVQLTSKGKEVFEHSKKIFADVEQLKTAVGQIKGEPQGTLLMGASEPVASHFIPPLLGKLLLKYPKIYPNILSGPASMLCERIRSGDLEFGLFFHTPENTTGLIVRPIKKIKFHLAVRKDLKKEKHVLESFIGSREIDDRTNIKFPTLAKLKRRYPNASIKISSNNLTTHKALVLEGAGVSILPDFLVGEEIKKGMLSEVMPNENFEFDLKLVTRSIYEPSLNAKIFLEIVI